MGAILDGILEGIQGGSFYFNFATSGLGVLVYVLQALALYTIAERRGINKPWLAWVPVVNVWILGSISDQYQYVVNRKVKNKRKVLLGLSIAFTAIMVFLIVFVIWGLLAGLLMMEPAWDAGTVPIQSDAVRDAIGALLVVGLLLIAVWVMLIVYLVFYYMAMYDVFRSSDPRNSTLYIVLSIVCNFVVDGVYCIFLMLCMNKDLGMPPRKQQFVPVTEVLGNQTDKTPVNTEE